MSDESKKIDDIANNSLYTSTAALATINYSYEIFSRYRLGEGSILELGPAEGAMTERLYRDGYRPELLEGSKVFCNQLRKKFPDLEVYNKLFEDFEPKISYNTIILGHVLEHVVDPVSILRKVRTWLTNNGRIFAAVPNKRSIHRQAAVIMGLINHEGTMSAKDIHHGHHRIYDPESFRHAFAASGLYVEHFGGYWLKPLSDSQIERDWTNEMLQAFLILGERYPDIAAEIYIIAKK
jgi:2-polyprenyl-3-methyl-5-hydroxy-6-metoxy-1,4-benzoquinol methylase